MTSAIRVRRKMKAAETRRGLAPMAERTARASRTQRRVAVRLIRGSAHAGRHVRWSETCWDTQPPPISVGTLWMARSEAKRIRSREWIERVIVRAGRSGVWCRRRQSILAARSVIRSGPGVPWPRMMWPSGPQAGSSPQSAPDSFTRDGLPVRLQIVGRRQEDATLLRAGAAYEAAAPWAGGEPPLE